MTKKKTQTTALVLRTCRNDLTSRAGFQWADVGGTTIAPDWEPSKTCGNGLHGWLYGAGDHEVSDYLCVESKWLVLEVELDGMVMLGGKCKFEKAKTLFVGDKKSATDYLIANEPRCKNVEVIGVHISVGDKESAIGGALSALTGGNYSALTGGNYSTLTGGDGSTLTGGNYSTLTGGYRSTLTGGNYSTLTGGYRSTLTGGDGSTLTGGDGSTLTGGYRSTLTGGDKSELRIKYWDDKAERYRTVIAYVGEDGIEPNVAYKLDENHKFIKAELAGE